MLRGWQVLRSYKQHAGRRCDSDSACTARTNILLPQLSTPAAAKKGPSAAAAAAAAALLFHHLRTEPLHHPLLLLSLLQVLL
jgi:hypothetical protein